MTLLKYGSLVVSGILLFIFVVGSYFEIRRYLRNLKKHEPGSQSQPDRGGK